MSVHEAEMAFLQLFEQLEIQSKSSKRRFPLLKLPRVVLLECIENLDIFEIIFFSLLSKRVKSIAKSVCLNLLDIHMSSTEKGPQIWFKLPNTPGLDWTIDYSTEIEVAAYPFFQSFFDGPHANHFLFIYDNGIEDLKQMVDHICEVFRSPISGIYIFDESHIEWIERIIKFQPTDRVWINKDIIKSVETLDRVFKNLKGTKYFRLESISIDENFQYKEPIPFRSITIDNSHWVTLSSILNGTNSIIRLYESKFTSKDINTILKEWQTGSKLRNLEFLLIQTTTSLDAAEVFEELNWTDGDEIDGRPTTV
ncbi:hypothetical protein B9Z55_012272 [Caenorhabditis nigoni]|nr:hypothetical protein B9Z55_012272 [Caenorhabditis nigoni]